MTFAVSSTKEPAHHKFFIEEINGAPALLSWSNGQFHWVLILDTFNGQITSLCSILNPDKLAFLQHQLEQLPAYRAGND